MSGGASGQRHLQRTGPGKAPAGAATTHPAQPVRPAAARGVTDPQELVRAFALLFCEVEAGRRTRHQLAPLMAPTLFARLSPVWVRPSTGPPATVQRVFGLSVSPERYEAAVVVRRRGRCGALTIALERVGGAWRVCEAARPEDGVLPEVPFAEPSQDPDSFDLVLAGRDLATPSTGS